MVTGSPPVLSDTHQRYTVMRGLLYCIATFYLHPSALSFLMAKSEKAPA